MTTRGIPDLQHTPGDELVPDTDEATLEQKETVGLSQAQIVRRRFFRHKGAMISLIVWLVAVDAVRPAVAAESAG